MTPLSAEARRRLEALFPETSRAAAATLLEERCGAALPLSRGVSSDSFDRIRFAVLKLSRGDLARLRLQVDAASRDWRDVLVAAGFADDIYAHRSWFPEGKSGNAAGTAERR